MRKVKHLMVNLTIDPDSVGPMWWAIVCPQGTTVGSINVTTSASATGMYETQPVCHELRNSRPNSRSYQVSAAQSHATSTTETQSHWSSGTPTQQQELLWERVVMLSPSNKTSIHINTPSGAVILHRPFLSFAIVPVRI